MTNYISFFVFRLVISFALFQCCSSSPFRDLNYAELASRLTALNGSFAHVSSAKDSFGIEEIQDGNDKCSPIVLRVSDLSSLSIDINRPQVLISGEIHGDERVVGYIFSFDACGEKTFSFIHVNILQISRAPVGTTCLTFCITVIGVVGSL
jgi:hypothetical protein